MVVAIPVGLGAAIYLAEYSDGRLRRILKPIIETLAGVPSVVMGFFALSVISPDFVKKLFSGAGTFSLLAAGIGVGILTVPLVASVAEDAMYAVPGALREAAYGIGARRRSVDDEGRVPRCGIGDRGGRDPGDLARGRRDDGGRDRGRRDRRPRCGRSISLGPGPDHDGRDLVARGRVRPGGGRGGPDAQPVRRALPGRFLLFVFTLVLNLVSERFVRRVRRNF